MNRRALLAAPLLAPTPAASPFAPTSAAAQATGGVAMEEHMVPARDRRSSSTSATSGRRAACRRVPTARC